MGHFGMRITEIWPCPLVFKSLQCGAISGYSCDKTYRNCHLNNNSENFQGNYRIEEDEGIKVVGIDLSEVGDVTVRTEGYYKDGILTITKIEVIEKCSTCVRRGVCPFNTEEKYSPEYCGKYNNYAHYL